MRVDSRPVLCLILFLACGARAHDKNSVKVSDEGEVRVIECNGVPEHSHGKFPNAHNPNTISAQKYVFRLPLNPKENDRLTPQGHSLFGVALNGVPFDPGTAEFWNDDRSSGWRYDAMSGKINLGLDKNNAHVQPNGAYHYHGLPLGLLGNRQGMLLVGYAADGFAIYSQVCGAGKVRASYQLKKGTRPNGPRGKYDGTFDQDFEFVAGSGELDECNGHVGPTPDNPKGVYHYHLTETYPFVPRYFRGTPDQSFQKQGGGRGPPGGRGGRGPRGGPGGKRPPPDPDDALLMGEDF